MDDGRLPPAASAVIRRRRRHLLSIAAAGVAAALGILSVLVFVSPAGVARAWGSATEVPATVVDVARTDDDRTSHWAVTFGWPDPDGGAGRTATFTVRSADRPFRDGDISSVFVAAGDVTFDDEIPPAIWAGEAAIVLLLGSAGWVIRRAGSWRRLRGAFAGQPPLRVRITDFSAASERQWWPLMDYTPVAGDAPDAVLRLYPQPPFVSPRVGEEFELWPLRGDRRGPVLIRRRGDGVWWAALYRPRLEPVDP